jgi:GNAT superfamily N-acetyltransferase
METCKGEYYLDSMAILPQYTGHKIGHALIQDAIEQGKQLNHCRFTLIAEKEAESLKAYYSVLGFIPEEEIMFFGHPYIRMALHI